MEVSLKQELHNLIDSCNEETALLEAKEVLSKNIDWWNDLTPAQQNDIEKLLNEPDDLNTISHNDFLTLTQKWHTK
ncbi:MAG: hypothetical protein JST29_08770 [Bacteroidetes bacterium]|nr:hypothetical protein [Bacteroidota bacterium]